MICLNNLTWTDAGEIVGAIVVFYFAKGFAGAIIDDWRKNRKR